MQIKPYAKNAKKHTKQQIAKIAASIKEFGFHQPIVVDKKGVIIVGHGRYLAAQSLGIENPPVIIADLSAKQAAAYRIADNKLNESEWDMKLVIDELKELDVSMVNVTGFDLSKISDEFNDFADSNKEVDIKGVASSLVHTCPKCGFQFGKGAK